MSERKPPIVSKVKDKLNTAKVVENRTKVQMEKFKQLNEDAE